MASQLEIQKRNLESSILFMQQEHAHTLRGLHEEISKLQKKCAELTFQLTMQSLPGINADDGPGKLERAETALHESELSRRRAELEAESSGRAAKQVRDQLQAAEKQFVEEMKSKNKHIAVLTAEVDAKSCTIAYLTTELHKVKAARRSRPASGGGSGGELTQQQQQADAPVVEPAAALPPPPELQRRYATTARAVIITQPPPQHRAAAQQRGQLPLSDDGLGAPRRRPASGRRLVGNSAESPPCDDGVSTAVDGIGSPTAVPDPTPFLQLRQQQQREHSADVVALKPTPPVLPPISSARRTGRAVVIAATTPAADTAPIVPPGAAIAGGSGQGRHHQRLLHGLRLDAGTRAPVSEVVGVLAVDRVPTTGQPYAQEPGSADCK